MDDKSFFFSSVLYNCLDSRFFIGKLEAMLVLPSILVEKFDDKFAEGDSYFDEKFVEKFTEGTLEV